jgi:DNA sulfur modification protein DndD
MWLSRVELLNFKSYRQQIFAFPQPTDGKNLALIGGVNGYGKTTLLEALYVGLYGEEAVKHKALDSAGLKAKSYGNFLETAFHRLAPGSGEDRMEVQVEFMREDGGALRVTRKWFFNSRGKYSDQKVIVETRAQTGVWMHRAEGMLPELLESYATPPWLAPFFFFDGEKIAGLADEDRTGWVQSGLENLLGVKLTKELREQLTTYIDKKLREAGGVDEQRVEQMKNALENDKAKESTLRETMVDLRQRHGNAKDERDRFSSQLAGLAQGSDARTVAEVAQSRSRAEAEVTQSWKRLRDLYAGPLPLQLIRRELQDSLAHTLAGEECLIDWEQSKVRMQPNWEKFRNTFFSSPWIGGLCHLPGARDSLDKTLSDAWESLHYPRPENCSDAVWHRYLQANERRKLEDMRAKSQVSSAQLRQALEAYQHAKTEAWRLQQELIGLEGVGGDGKAQQIETLRADLKQAQDQYDEFGRQLNTSENELTALLAEIKNQDSAYERERKKLLAGHPERQAAREAEKVVEMIDSLLPSLFNLKLQALSEAVTRIFRALHHKDQIARIEISRDGRTTLYSHDGTEINLPKSSGESQLFVLALVGALAEVTGYRVPMIIDTPLARLSEIHCQNLLRYWTSDPERQVILLAQDKEISAQDYAGLNSSVNKTYLLRHKQISQGVGQSEAIENAYFGEMA